jgi:hypothetical protein
MIRTTLSARSAMLGLETTETGPKTPRATQASARQRRQSV